MRLKWCTFQSCKVQLPTRKLLLWQVCTVRMKAILFYSTNMMQCFIYHIKSDSSGQFPLTLLNQLQKLYFALLQGYRSSDDQPIPLNTHLHQEANLLLVGWLPAWQFPSRYHQSDKETHRSFVLQRKFSMYLPFLEPAHCPTHRERQKVGGQLRQWERSRSFTPLTTGPAALQCEFPQKTVLNCYTQICQINKLISKQTTGQAFTSLLLASLCLI